MNMNEEVSTNKIISALYIIINSGPFFVHSLKMSSHNRGILPLRSTLSVFIWPKILWSVIFLPSTAKDESVSIAT